SYIIRRGERPLMTTDTGTAIPHHERTNLSEDTLDGFFFTVDSVTDEDVEVVPHSGHRRMQPCRYDEGPTSLNTGRRWPLRCPDKSITISRHGHLTHHRSGWTDRTVNAVSIGETAEIRDE